ncbi:hypothetical protein GJAV_G00018550 [Gymnothorax javanicus]|nr:hypothetical protein GJAV_G00018550 [Gymnothorax javanicus]
MGFTGTVFSFISHFPVTVVSLEKSLQSLGTSRDTAELRQNLHSTQQQTNKVITSTSQLIKQLSDIVSGSSRQDRLRLTRLKTELSDSVQRYGDLQKKIADRSRALLPPAQKDQKQSPQTPFAELCDEEPVFGGAESTEGGSQAFLAEISEEDVEALRQREEALLQIEVPQCIPSPPYNKYSLHPCLYLEAFNKPLVQWKTHSCTTTQCIYCSSPNMITFTLAYCFTPLL